MSKPRILHLVQDLDVGGAEVLLADLAPRIDAREFDVHAACLVRVGPPFELLRQRGVPVHHLGKRPGIDLGGLWRLTRLLEDLDVTILHAHAFPANLWGRLAALGARTPIVVCTVHVEAGWRAPFKRTTINRLLRPFTDKIVAVSDSVRQSLMRVEGVPDEMIRVIHNGIILERFRRSSSRAQDRSRLGLPTSGTVVGMAARASEEKGGRYLVEAVARLAAEGRALHAVVLGDGAALADWRALASELGVAERITFAGRVDNVPEWLAVLDLFVSPSLEESFGIAAIEAQAAGLPVVGTRVGGLLEVLNDGEDALLVERADATALAQAMARVLDAPELASRLAAAGRRNVEDHFAIDRTAREHEALYRELLAQEGLALPPSAEVA